MSDSEQFQYQFGGETALRDTMERLEFALAATKLGVWDLNLLTGKAFCSNQCKQILGIPFDDVDVMEEIFLNNLHPEDCTRVIEAATNAISEKVNCSSEYRVFWQDGSVHWVAAKANTIYGADGQPLRMVGTVDHTPHTLIHNTLRKLFFQSWKYRTRWL